jgi:hypothetical protein
MKSSVRKYSVMVVAACAFLFASAASAASWAFNIPVDGNPSFSEQFRRDALINYVGQNGTLSQFANGDTIVVNWTGGQLGWRSTWAVSVTGSAYSFSETTQPVNTNLRYMFADQQRYCQGSSTITLDGYWQGWEVVIGGQVVNSGTEFVTTGAHSSITSLCYQNV